MKKILLLTLSLIVIIVSGCKDKNENTINAPTSVETMKLNNIAYTSVNCGVKFSGGNVTDAGICWGTSNNPTTNDNKIAVGNKAGSYERSITGLIEGTVYYFKAYIVADGVTIYGNEKWCTTYKKGEPMVEIFDYFDLKPTSVLIKSNVIADGGVTITEKGICWDTKPNPTIDANKKVATQAGAGSFSIGLTDLTENTTYYVAAYAISEKGTSYSATVLTLTTKGLATINIKNASNITRGSATINCEMLNDGGYPIMEQGIYWATKANPTMSDNKIVANDPYAKSFSLTIDGLAPGTPYYVKPYAITVFGTSFGPELNFTTPIFVETTIKTVGADQSGCGYATMFTYNLEAVNDGAAEEVGIVYSTASTPELNKANSLKIISDQKTVGEYKCKSLKLAQGTKYYYRAYAIKEGVTTYGTIAEFTSRTGLGYLQFINTGSANGNTFRFRKNFQGSTQIETPTGVFPQHQIDEMLSIQNAIYKFGSRRLFELRLCFGITTDTSDPLMYIYFYYDTAGGSSYGSTIHYSAKIASDNKSVLFNNVKPSTSTLFNPANVDQQPIDDYLKNYFLSEAFVIDWDNDSEDGTMVIYPASKPAHYWKFTVVKLSLTGIAKWW